MSIALLARSLRIGRSLATLLAGLVAFAVLGACEGSSGPTARPSPVFSIGLPESPSPTASPSRTPRPTPSAPWPEGWADEFCAAFAQVKIVQELVVDVERAIEDEDMDDALALARELRATAVTASEMLAQLEQWKRAQPAINEIATLLEAAPRIARNYARYLDEGRQRSLDRARELAQGTRPVVEDANEALARLSRLGLSCGTGELALEAP